MLPNCKEAQSADGETYPMSRDIHRPWFGGCRTMDGEEKALERVVRFGCERREPRCRVCRDENVRVLVNQLLEWRGVPVVLQGGSKHHRITYADILRDLEQLNEGRDERDRITYDSLWVHAKRHCDPEALAGYWSARMPTELRKALRR